jgi:hypothetical protein
MTRQERAYLVGALIVSAGAGYGWAQIEGRSDWSATHIAEGACYIDIALSTHNENCYIGQKRGTCMDVTFDRPCTWKDIEAFNRAVGESRR